MRKSWAAVVAFLLGAAPVVAAPITAPPAAALGNGLALTPPMGWNDWNAFGCSVSEQLVEQTADKIVSSGLRSAGYQYVNIDDCWMAGSRSATGDLVPDPVKFPHGIKGVADYVHARGLKLGIYESAGTMTCAGYPGSLGHEQQDANSFAAWGVDYLKYDNCNNLGIPARQRYQAMGNALARTGRPIVYSLCDWGQENVASWGGSVSNLWRTTGDIDATYGRMLSIFHQNVGLADAASPGAWNDPDMLEVGNGMTATEDRSEFSLWAEMASPLIAGTDLRHASVTTLATYGNKEVIAIDQDRLGRQGRPVSMTGGLDVLAKPLADHSVAVALFNENAAPAKISTIASALGLPAANGYTVRDVWAHTTTATAGAVQAFVPGHGTVLYRVAATSMPGRYPPHVMLTTTAPAWLAGTSATVTSTLTNNGVGTAADVRLGFAAPTRWTVTPLSRTYFARIPRGGTAVATFRVTAPAVLPAPITRSTVSGTASGHAPGGTWLATASRPVELSAPVKPPFHTFSDTTAVFGAQGGRLAVDGAGADLWGDTDQYSAIYQHAAEHDGSTTVVEVAAQGRTSEWAKAGIMVRDDITAPGTSPGYLILAEAPGKGYVLQWDSTGSGHLDSNSAPPNQGTATAVYPSWLKLVRAGTTFTGYYSTDGITWTRLATATVPGATAAQDVGVFTSSHSDGTSGEADFSDFTQH
ncbi:NEW3 domain-containing protein [Streptomyces silvisoli]|uniref:Alpha-galactosidase n=1 Tax=Streptomyces silvisoli TaxID=3034235 RepID=A0ABT5ZTD2_9ACTN|nr:NEW3 domain-containing protein [Streptomyces silvisoli]MDF3293087.1 NEW3 domain-containing protein [Streptomyces silvisoli]